MLLNQLICRAASVYPEAQVLEHWDMENSGVRNNPGGGDTLARFVALEIADTYEENETDYEQVAAAARAMRRAADDLNAVAFALERMERECEAA